MLINDLRKRDNSGLMNELNSHLKCYLLLYSTLLMYISFGLYIFYMPTYFHYYYKSCTDNDLENSLMDYNT